MTDEIRTFDITIPTGSTPLLPGTFPLVFPQRIVESITLRIPPGPHGDVGLQIAAAGQVIIPYNAGEYVITDNEIIKWDLTGYPTSGSWALVAYNTGTFPHTIGVRFALNIAGQPGGVVSPVLPILGLTGQV